MFLHISNIIVTWMFEICWERIGDRKFSERDYSTNLQLSFHLEMGTYWWSYWWDNPHVGSSILQVSLKKKRGVFLLYHLKRQCCRSFVVTIYTLVAEVCTWGVSGGSRISRREGAKKTAWGANLLFSKILMKTLWKWKKSDGGARLWGPLGSANDYSMWSPWERQIRRKDQKYTLLRINTSFIRRILKGCWVKNQQ